MTSFLKKNRELLAVAVLLLVPLALFLTSGRKGRQPIWLDRAVVASTSFIARGVSWGVDGTVQVWSSYVWLKGAKQENKVLKDENARLQAELHAMEEVRLENERLRKLLNYAEATGGNPIAAKVIGVNPDPNNLSLRIDRGEADGLSRGMPVVTPDGVVGHVIRVVPHAADVLLMHDPHSKVGVMVQRTRVRAIAGVEGADRSLKLQFALRSESVDEGDLVVTSGTDGVFPAGLVVGRLTKVDRHAPGTFQSAEILPAVDATRLEEVLVMPSPPSSRMEPAGAPPSVSSAPAGPSLGARR
ncbi:MAG TPA: rod shape-determining protein MreC [Myxococcaceae bacterium]|nr:rod shape-determining protein MreC [Myxococcaceae bacterium]